MYPGPEMVTFDIVPAPVPVLVRVKAWRLLDPATTFPKFRLVAFAASVPEEVAVELDFAAGVPALVKPTQPEIDNTARHAKIRVNMPSGARRLGVA